MAMDKARPLVPGRRLLRALRGVEMWHIEDGRKSGQGTPAVHYSVKQNGREDRFERPHEAWQHFQQLTGARDRDTRPEPPPLDETFLKPRTDRPDRRRSRPKPA